MLIISTQWDQHKRRNEAEVLANLTRTANLTKAERDRIVNRALGYVKHIRQASNPGLMEAFLTEYGLSTDEGVALMCLAEALLRIPDAATIDALINDKVSTSDWSVHLGQSSSPLVNASTWGLMLTGKILASGQLGIEDTLRRMVQRLREPFIRSAVTNAIRQMRHQFVLGETIDQALSRAAKQEADGYHYSYDMLGEAALTAQDAERYRKAYTQAINQIGSKCAKGSMADNPGISVKLSAGHPH